MGVEIFVRIDFRIIITTSYTTDKRAIKREHIPSFIRV